MIMNKVQGIASLSMILMTLMMKPSLVTASEMDQAAPRADSYTAFIGNHDAVKITLSSVDLRVQNNRSSSQVTYVLNWENETISVKNEDGTASLTLAPHGEDYASTLVKIRDLVAYTAIPQRFSWGADGAASLNLSLQPTVARLEALVSKYLGFEPNCIVYSENSGSELAVAAGVYGDLGFLSDSLTKAWVKSGYELVLVPSPGFSLSEGPASLYSDAEGQSLSYDLGEAGSSVGSLACRPLMH